MRRLEGPLILAAYTALAVWWLWPLPSLMTDHSAYFSAEFPLVIADFYLIVWTLAWGAHALVTAPWQLFHANAFHPATSSLAFSEHLLGDAPLFAPVYWATGNPILAVNVFVLATFVLSALAMYALVRRYTGPPAALVAGFFYAFYPWRYDSLAHLHMLAVQYFPLVFLFTDRWLETARRRDVVLLALALILQALSSFYLAYALVLAYGPFLLVALWHWRSRLDRRRLVGLGIAVSVVAVVMIMVSLPYLRLRQLGVIPSYGGEDDAPSLGLIPFIATAQVRKYLYERGIGPVGYLLALVAVLPPWRGRRDPWLAGVLVAAVGTLAAFGPGILIGGREYASPYRLLGLLPGFGTVRLPTRFVLVAQLGFALLAGLGLGRLLAGRRHWLVWPIALAAIALGVRSFSPLPKIPLHAESTGDRVPPPIAGSGHMARDVHSSTSRARRSTRRRTACTSVPSTGCRSSTGTAATACGRPPISLGWRAACPMKAPSRTSSTRSTSDGSSCTATRSPPPRRHAGEGRYPADSSPRASGETISSCA